MKQKKINVCVIDDEDGIRKSLIEAINASKKLKVICEAKCVDSGVKAIITKMPELIFLDIKLIGGDAFILLDKLKRSDYDIPPVVINTGFEEFELAQRILNEYKEEVLIILKKPFWENWEEKESVILKKFYEMKFKNETKVKKDRIIITTRYKTHIIRIDDVIRIFFDSNDTGVSKAQIVTDYAVHYVRKSLSILENELPRNFIRINRNDIINCENVREYDHSEQVVYLYDIKEGFDVGNTYKSKFLRYLNNI